MTEADMLTLPLSAEVYRFLSASSAYRFAIQIFRFLSNLPLSNHWVLVTPSDWLFVTFFFFEYKSLHYAGVPLNEERKITERLIK